MISGEAPKGATLSIAKAFETETSPVLQPAADGSLSRPHRSGSPSGWTARW